MMLALALPARAQTAPDLPPETPPELRRYVETIQRYYQAVGERVGTATPPSPATAAAPGDAPAAALPDVLPDATRRMAPERDPFDVTPELRNRRGQRQAEVGANLFPSTGGQLPPMTIKAIFTGTEPVALVLVKPERGQGRASLVRLREGDTLTLDDGTNIRVRAIRPGVVSLQTGPNPNDEYLLR
jgi:hypothetical protein